MQTRGLFFLRAGVRVGGGRGALTSAARHGGVQPRALGDADLGGLLGAGRVDAHCLQQVAVGGAAPEGGTHEDREARGGVRAAGGRGQSGWRAGSERLRDYLLYILCL